MAVRRLVNGAVSCRARQLAEDHAALTHRPSPAW
jgi:hypothetical protein